jgi:hypothetical protein
MSEPLMPEKLLLDAPEPLLALLGKDPERVSLDEVRVAEMWALAGLAALARFGRPRPLGVRMDSPTPASKFAYAVGFADVTAGKKSTTPGIAGRTVKMARFGGSAHTEPLADKVAKLLAPGDAQEGVRRTLYYVLNELLRNTLQHSQDSLGGIVGAQFNDGGRNADRPIVQVVVADNGVGIFDSLKTRHVGLTDPREALDKSLWPHFSSAFDLGETGSSQNAGMGLFFISELTKLVAGRLLVASRGAALELTGDENFENPHGVQRFLTRGVGYPGTLVAFEMPALNDPQYESMIEQIRERAAARTPARTVNKWLRFDAPPKEMSLFHVIARNGQIEDVASATEFARNTLLPRVTARASVLLDFGGIPVVTQSYVHALLYEALRVAWALKVPIYVSNAAPAVRSTLELLQNYALGG